MHFCEKCDNMYYIRLADEDGNKLIYYCRNCGHEDSLITHENVCVNKTQIKHKEQSYVHIINNYTKLDPTLPRTKTIKCPNPSCSSIKDEDQEVLYIRYDDTNMKYIYLCGVCNTTWKIDEQI
jgi:DNA-directed RNA polymerase subunit M/transcription elongation factor TFIIS